MTEPTNGLPEPRTLFRSPPRAARNTPLSGTAQDVIAEAVAAQFTVDLCTKNTVCRALSRVLEEVWRAGTRGLLSSGLANVRAVLRIVCEAVRAGSYEKLIVSLDGGSSSDNEYDPRGVRILQGHDGFIRLNLLVSEFVSEPFRNALQTSQVMIQ